MELQTDYTKKNPFYTARPLELENMNQIYNDQQFDLGAERKGNLFPKDYLLYS